MREAFKRVFVEFEERRLPELVERELVVKASPYLAIRFMFRVPHTPLG